MRIMYDLVNAGAIPTSAVLVAGYVDGRYRWSAADWARFPNATHVPIAVFPSTNAGVVLDVETGDATPAQAPGWVKMRRAAGVDPTVYCNTGVWPAVRAAFAAARIVEPHYWVAAYPGNGPNLYPGSVAHQYADPVTSGGNFDLSVVADIWPGVDSPTGGFGAGLGTGTYTPLPPIASNPTTPGTAPTPIPQEDDMYLKFDTTQGGHLITSNGVTALTGQEWNLLSRLLASNAAAGSNADAYAGADQFLPAEIDVIRAAIARVAPAPATVTNTVTAPAVDYAAIAKAVNDDAAKRLAS